MLDYNKFPCKVASSGEILTYLLCARLTGKLLTLQLTDLTMSEQLPVGGASQFSRVRDQVLHLNRDINKFCGN